MGDYSPKNNVIIMYNRSLALRGIPIYKRWVLMEYQVYTDKTWDPKTNSYDYTFKKSDLHEYTRVEGPIKKYSHINHPSKPLQGKWVENEKMSNIWLKTYGLTSWMIECQTENLEDVLKYWGLQLEERNN